jgi:hypothetical protein
MIELSAVLGKGIVGVNVVLAGVMGVPATAHATLGGDSASVEANRQALGGELRVEKLPYGERYTMLLPMGIVIRQYLSPSGAVYAVTWNGPRMPNLSELFGKYAEQYSHRDRPKGERHHMAFGGNDFMMRASGHMRTFSGRAWVPSLVPPGIDLDSVLSIAESP